MCAQGEAVREVRCTAQHSGTRARARVVVCVRAMIGSDAERTAAETALRHVQDPGPAPQIRVILRALLRRFSLLCCLDLPRGYLLNWTFV